MSAAALWTAWATARPWLRSQFILRTKRIFPSLSTLFSIGHIAMFSYSKGLTRSCLYSCKRNAWFLCAETHSKLWKVLHEETVFLLWRRTSVVRPSLRLEHGEVGQGIRWAPRGPGTAPRHPGMTPFLGGYECVCRGRGWFPPGALCEGRDLGCHDSLEAG